MIINWSKETACHIQSVFLCSDIDSWLVILKCHHNILYHWFISYPGRKCVIVRPQTWRVYLFCIIRDSQVPSFHINIHLRQISLIVYNLRQLSEQRPSFKFIMDVRITKCLLSWQGQKLILLQMRMKS